MTTTGDGMREALEKAAAKYVRCARPHSGLSPYIKENGLHGRSPWSELCDAVAALSTKQEGEEPSGRDAPSDEQSPWRPMASAPKDGTELLLIYEHKASGTRFRKIGRWAVDVDGWDIGSHVVDNVICWQPLLSPPLPAPPGAVSPTPEERGCDAVLESLKASNEALSTAAHDLADMARASDMLLAEMAIRIDQHLKKRGREHWLDQEVLTALKQAADVAGEEQK